MDSTGNQGWRRVHISPCKKKIFLRVGPAPRDLPHGYTVSRRRGSKGATATAELRRG